MCFKSFLGITFSSVFLFLFSISVSGSFLELRDIQVSVDKTYPVILSAQAEVQKTQADAFSAQGGFDPQLHSSYGKLFGGYYNYYTSDFSIEQPTPFLGTKVFAGWRTGNGSFPVYDAGLMTFTNGEIRFGLEVPLLKGRKTDERRTRLLTTKKNVEIAQEGLEVQKKELQKQASQKYWDWVASGRKIFIMQDLLKIAVDRDLAIQSRVQHGDLAKIDQTDNERSILQRKSSLIVAQRAFQRSAFELSLYYRDSFGNPIIASLDSLNKDVSYSDLDQVLKDAEFKMELIQKHPEMNRLSAQIMQTQAELDLADNQVLPKLDAKFGVYSDQGQNLGSKYLPPTNYPTQWKASVSLEFPILFRAPRGKRDAMQASLQKIEAMQTITLNKLQIQAQDSFFAMQAAQEKLKLAQEEIKLAIDLENSEKLRAFHGDSSFMFVNLREQMTRDAMSKEVDAYSEFYKAKADYDYCMS